MMLTDLLALSHVPRWVIVPHLRPQSVAEHSHRVAVIYLELCARLNLTATVEGLTWAIMHDGPESRTGDIPAPFKRELDGKLAVGEQRVCPWLDNRDDSLGSTTYWLFQLADLIEAYTFIARWGKGSHASRAELGLLEKLDQHIGYGPNHGEAVRKLVDDILYDIER